MALTRPYLATAQWKKQRIRVLKRDSYTCAYCGDAANEVDHVVARVKGGSDDLDNLVAACRRCNIRKKDADVSVFLAGNSTPPVFAANRSPKGINGTKTDTIQTSSIPNSPFEPPSVTKQSEGQ